jgi:hypothetical protein
MNEQKKAYLSRVRSETAYPTFRTFVELWRFLNILLGIGVFLYGISLGDTFGSEILKLLFFLYGALTWAAGEIMRWISNMLIDIADSVIDLNYRYEPGEQGGE